MNSNQEASDSHMLLTGINIWMLEIIKFKARLAYSSQTQGIDRDRNSFCLHK